MRLQYESNHDLLYVQSQPRVNFDPDLKRELVGVHDVDGLICATTRPWRTIESFHEARDTFDLWRKSQRRVLKVARDWAEQLRWAANAASRRAAHSRSRADRPALVSIFIRAWARKAFGLPGNDYGWLARELTAAGWPVSVGTIKNAVARGPALPARSPVGGRSDLCDVGDGPLARLRGGARRGGVAVTRSP